MVSNQTKLPSCIFGTRGGHSHRCRSHSCDRGQEAVKGFLVSVKRSRTIFKLRNSGQDVYVLRVGIAHSVVKCVQSNGQGRACGAVKWSSNKNNGQNFLALVAAVTTAPMGVWYKLTFSSCLLMLLFGVSSSKSYLHASIRKVLVM